MTMMETVTRASSVSGPGGPAGVEREAAEVAAALFRSMGDPTRVVILQHLLLGEHNVRELTEHLGLAQSTVSAHLACLRDCGMVDSRPVGRASLFSVTHPEQVLALLRSAEQLLAVAGDAVALCPSGRPGGAA